MITWAEAQLEHNPHIDYFNANAQKAFDSLNATLFASHIKVLDADGKFDAKATAELIGFAVEEHPIKALGGFNMRGKKIFVQEGQSAYQHDLTVAHEIGHIFINNELAGDCREYMNLAELEGFCEYFAHHMVDNIPVGQLCLFETKQLEAEAKQ